MCRGERSGCKPSQKVTLCPAIGPLRCTILVFAMSLLLPTVFDRGMTRDLNQDWREITPRVGNGSGKSYARFLYPLVWQSGCRGQPARPFQVSQGWGESGRCCCTGVLIDLCSAVAFLGPTMGPSAHGNVESNPGRGCIVLWCGGHPKWIFLERRECNPVDRVVLRADEGGDLIAL